MNKTKKKIILAAIDLFNKQGLANVKNQAIAKHADVSLSNFNYHFGTKKDLVLTVFDYMKTVLEEDIYSKNTLLTQEGQGLEIAKSYFEFEQQFCFFYLDSNNILQTYPELQEAIQQQIVEAIQIIKNINYLAIGKGYLKPPPVDMPNLYDLIAEQIWVTNHFWFAQMNIRGLEGDVVQKGLAANIAITYPYMTELGKAKYQSFLKGEKMK